MKTVTLSNSFHNTEVRVRVPEQFQHEAWLYIQQTVFGMNNPSESDKQRYRRVRRTLCGMSDCTCGVVR